MSTDRTEAIKMSCIKYCSSSVTAALMLVVILSLQEDSISCSNLVTWKQQERASELEQPRLQSQRELDLNKLTQGKFPE